MQGPMAKSLAVEDAFQLASCHSKLLSRLSVRLDSALPLLRPHDPVPLQDLQNIIEGQPMKTPTTTLKINTCHHDWQLELHNHETQTWSLWVHGAFDDVMSDYIDFRNGHFGDRIDKARLVGPYRCFSTTCPGCDK